MFQRFRSIFPLRSTLIGNIYTFKVRSMEHFYNILAIKCCVGEFLLTRIQQVMFANSFGKGLFLCPCTVWSHIFHTVAGRDHFSLLCIYRHDLTWTFMQIPMHHPTHKHPSSVEIMMLSFKVEKHGVLSTLKQTCHRILSISFHISKFHFNNLLNHFYHYIIPM